MCVLSRHLHISVLCYWERWNIHCWCTTHLWFAIFVVGFSALQCHSINDYILEGICLMFTTTCFSFFLMSKGFSWIFKSKSINYSIVSQHHSIINIIIKIHCRTSSTVLNRSINSNIRQTPPPFSLTFSLN